MREPYPPPLSVAERDRSARLCVECRDDPDRREEYLQERRRLVESLLGLIASTAAPIAKRGRRDVEELVAVGTAAAIESIDRWSPSGGAGVATWCRQRAKWAMQEFCRKEGSESSRTSQPLDGDEPRIDRRLDPLAAAIAGESAEKVRTALAALPDREREILRRLYFDGDSAIVVAAEYSLSRQRIYQLRNQALRGLKEALGEPNSD